MASIKKYKSATAKKGYLWRVQYRDPQGRNRSKRGFDTKTAAETWAAKNTVDLTTGDWILPTAGTITIDDLGAKWLSMQTHLKPSTFRTTEQVWRVHVQPHWGVRQISSIRPSAVQDWVASIDRSGSLVRKAHACLAQILDMAKGDGLIKNNPARGVRLPQKAKGKHVYLTIDQLRMFADEASKHSELIWLLGTVGLRWGEAAALRVQDVNVLRRRINVERNAVTVGYEVHFGTPKTHEKRTVAVSKSVMDMLVQVMDGKPSDGLLWSREDGSPLRVPAKDDWFYGAMYRVMKRTKNSDNPFPRITPHGLRHVAAGLMVSAGTNVKVVQRQLGHASAVMTLDTYSDLFDGDLDEVALRMDEKIVETLRSIGM